MNFYTSDALLFTTRMQNTHFDFAYDCHTR